MNRLFHLSLAVISLFGAAPALAHHSFSATFQDDAKITREGRVTDFSFRNPHVLVYFDVTNEDGSVTKWVSEGSAATLMRRRGWSKDSINVGDTIRVFGDSTHDGSPMTSIDTIDIIDPKSGAILAALMEQNGQAEDPSAEKAAAIPLTLPDGHPNISGYWTNHGMANGRPRPPEIEFSEAGAALQAAFDVSRDPQVFCDPPGLFRQVSTTPHPIRITQQEDRMIFEYEEFGGYREVFFDDRAHLGYKTHMGDSIAFYEGDTLVIETNNLLANQASPAGHILSDQTTTREVYSRDDDDTYGPIVLLTMYADDPINATEQIVTSRQKMSAGTDYDFIENDCHPPLRERDTVNPKMSFFATAERVPENESTNAYCANLAATVEQGDKFWVGATDLSMLSNGPWYTAKGELLADDLGNLNADSDHLKQISLTDYKGRSVELSEGGVLYCIAP